MPPEHSTSISSSELRRKNLTVVTALACGIVLPFLHIAFVARFLPDWLDAVIVGGIFWVCFAEVIPANVVGVFRRPMTNGDKSEAAQEKSESQR